MARQLTPQAWAMIKDVAAMTFVRLDMYESELVSAMIMAYEHGHGLSTAWGGINVIGGKPALAPKLMWADVIKSEYFSGYEEEQLKDVSGAFLGWTITLHRSNDVSISRSFTIEDARTAGLLGHGGKMYKKYALDMTYWRAMGRVCQAAFPDVVEGVYTTAELSHGEWAVPDEPKERQYTLADIMSLGASPDRIMEVNGGAIPATQADINLVYGILSGELEREALTTEEGNAIDRAIEEDTNGTG